MRSVKPNAITVCVDYHDILSLTLPKNRKYFNEFVIVTTPTDRSTHKLAVENDCNLIETNSFYENGAIFNKWIALEKGLDSIRYNNAPIVIIDADIVLPSDIPDFEIEQYKLYTPLRRMLYDIPGQIPEESLWGNLPYHRQQTEWAGYFQLFWPNDPVLGNPPWHEIDWKHAGGADSFFQAKWNRSDKLRPPFEVLHLGESGKNWCGRATKFIDGSEPERIKENQEAISSLFRARRQNRGRDRFKSEKIG